MIRIDDPNALGPVLAQLRAVSQRALVADIDGMSQSQLADWERGHSLPKLPNLIRLAHALGYDLALIPREDADGR